MATFGIPRAVGFTHAIRDFNTPVSVQSADGSPSGVRIEKQKRHLTLDMAFVAQGGAVCGGSSYKFADTADTLCSVDELLEAAGVNAESVWQQAYDAVRSQFPVTADPAEGMQGIAIPFFPRLEQVKANLNPSGPMAIMFTVGMYWDEAKTQLATMFELTFVDNKTLEQRAKNLETLQSQIAQLDEMIAGSHANQQGLTVEQLAKSKEQATAEKPVMQARIEQQQRQLVGSMSDILQIQSVQTAFGAIVRTAVTELKASQPSWASFDVDGWMTFFGPALQAVAAA
jgi:hypothetical protein